MSRHGRVKLIQGEVLAARNRAATAFKWRAVLPKSVSSRELRGSS
jgi:hypothetical protein